MKTVMTGLCNTVIAMHVANRSSTAAPTPGFCEDPQEEGDCMPRRSILSATERESLLAPPDAKDELIRLYTFNDADLSRIRQHRGAANRLGFAVQLCYMRYPGITLTADTEPDAPLLHGGRPAQLPGDIWNDYGQRAETRREHLLSCSQPMASNRSRH